MRRTRYIAQGGVIAAVYAALTILVVQLGGVLSWGPVQLRPSEALTVLAAFTPAAIPGLTLGSVIANAVGMTQTGALGLFDVVFGSLGTLLGALWTWRFRRNLPLALLGPVLANALIVPAYLPVILRAVGALDVTYRVLGIDATRTYAAMYAVGLVGVAVGEGLVVYILGLPLAHVLRTVLPQLQETSSSADDKTRT